MSVIEFKKESKIESMLLGTRNFYAFILEVEKYPIRSHIFKVRLYDEDICQIWKMANIKVSEFNIFHTLSSFQ